MKTLPSELAPYKRTPTFTEQSVPVGLTRAHKTKAGTWGKIVILKGQLLYRILEPQLEEVLLSENHHGVVEPAVPHEVEPQGKVEFFVEFYAAAGE
ncbi:MAG: DUF1971 domain-containing protein [Pseudomonadales bacterium]